MDSNGESTQVALKFDEHHKRLGNIVWLAYFLDNAVAHAPLLAEKPPRQQALQQVVDGFVAIGRAVSPSHKFDPEELKANVHAWATPTEECRTLIYTLSLV